MYVKNAWYVVSWLDELGDDAPVAVSVLGEPIVLWRSDGRCVALEDRCVHRLAPLSRGRCEAGQLRCMYHGFLFSPDGKVVHIPGQDVIPPGAAVRSYPVAEKHSWLWVWMGDPRKADESEIPPAIGFDDPDWMLGNGRLDYKAEAKLISENLLDFSHFSFVHENSLQVGRDYAENLPKVTPLPRAVRFERWDVRTLQDPPVDSFTEYEYHIPGILINWRGAYPAGTARSLDFQRPDRSAAVHQSCSSQAVTPMGDKSARYFFSFGFHRRDGDAGALDGMMAVLDKAFKEDREMIEAQQEIIDLTPRPRVMPSKHDRGITIFTNQIQSLVRAEAREVETLSTEAR